MGDQPTSVIDEKKLWTMSLLAGTRKADCSNLSITYSTFLGKEHIGKIHDMSTKKQSLDLLAMTEPKQ